MSNKTILAMSLILALALLVGCQSQEAATATEAPESSGASGTALQVTGKVDMPLALTLADLQGMDVVEITATQPGKEERTYQGVRLNALLDMAGVQADAATLTMTAADDYASDLPLADVRACADCLVAFDDDGSLRLAMPDMEGRAWVKQLVTIEVK